MSWKAFYWQLGLLIMLIGTGRAGATLTLLRQYPVGTPKHFTALAYSPDGTRLATVDNQVHVLNSTTGQELMVFGRGRENIQYSRDGQVIAVTSGSTICSYLAMTGDALATHTVASELSRCILLTSETALVALRASVEIVNLRTHAAVWTHAATTHSLHLGLHIAVSPDRSLYAFNPDYEQVLVYRASDRQQVGSATAAGIYGITLSPDNQRIAFSTYNWLNITTLDGTVLLHNQIGQYGPLEFSANGERLLVGIYSLTNWDASTTRTQAKGSFADPTAWAVNPVENTVAVMSGNNGSRSACIKTYDLENLDVRSIAYFDPAVNGTDCAISPDGRLLAVTTFDGGHMKLLDAASGALLQLYPYGFQQQSVFAFYAETGQLLVSAGNQHYLLEAETGRITGSLAPIAGTFSGNGRRIFNFDTTYVRVWDAFNGALLKTLQNPYNQNKSVLISDDGRRVANFYTSLREQWAGIPAPLYFYYLSFSNVAWSVDSGLFLGAFYQPEYSVGVSPPDFGYFGLSGDGQTLVLDTGVYQLPSHAYIRPLTIPAGGPKTMRLSYDGTVAFNYLGKVSKPQTGVLVGDTNKAWTAASISPDGSKLLSMDLSNMWLHDLNLADITVAIQTPPGEIAPGQPLRVAWNLNAAKAGLGVKLELFGPNQTQGWPLGNFTAPFGAALSVCTLPLNMPAGTYRLRASSLSAPQFVVEQSFTLVHNNAADDWVAYN